MKPPIEIAKTSGIILELHPWNLTWNLKRSPWKRWFLLETIIFRFHVKFRGNKLDMRDFERKNLGTFHPWCPQPIRPGRPSDSQVLPPSPGIPRRTAADAPVFFLVMALKKRPHGPHWISSMDIISLIYQGTNTETPQKTISEMFLNGCEVSNGLWHSKSSS